MPANGIHFLADNSLDLAQDPQPQRQPGVQPRPNGPDIARADQQLVAGHLGIGGVVAQCAQEELGHAGDHSRQPYSRSKRVRERVSRALQLTGLHRFASVLSCRDLPGREADAAARGADEQRDPATHSNEYV